MTSCSCKQRTSAGRPVPHLHLPPHQLCLHDGGDRLTAVLLLSCTSAETEPQQLFIGMFPRVISNIGAGICSPESVKMFAVKLFRLSFSGVLMLQVQPQNLSRVSPVATHWAPGPDTNGGGLKPLGGGGNPRESWFQTMLAYLAFMLRGAAVLGVSSCHSDWL